MKREFVLTRPWSDVTSAEIETVTAYTFPEERKVAMWLTRDCYTGEGEIIDAGAFFGGSALSLAVGLRQNPKMTDADKAGRIHSFDNFTWAPWIKKDLVPPDAKFGSSFLNVFHDTIRKYQDLLVIHPGDVEKRRWRLGPIEILFIDCAKSFEANSTIVEMFFPNLIPGLSIINHQDYAVPARLVWIYATMEYFWDKFEDLGTTLSGGTTLFRLASRIDEEEARSCVKALRTDCLALAERAIVRYPTTDRRNGAIRKSIEFFRQDPLPLPSS